MASVPTTGYKILVQDRRYEDYTSMKQWFRNSKVIENIFSASQVSDVVTIIDGSDVVIATPITAEALVYLRIEADVGAAQDLKSVWVTYQDDTGAIIRTIDHMLNDTADNTVEAALGYEDIRDVIDTGEGGKVILLTGLAGTLNQYAGMYMITQSGAGVGDVNLIVSNTNATPTTLTVTDNTNAGADDDIIQIQTYDTSDFYRVREMYCEVEPGDDAQILLCDHNMGNIYYAIAEGGRYSAHSGFFTQPTATCRSFLGRVKAVAANVLEAAVADSGQIVSITFTPIAANANGDSADITMSLQFTNTLDWQPCIELEPATDVTVKITDVTTATPVHVEVTCLEVYPTNN